MSGAGPRVYAEWLPLLDLFRSGDDSTVPAMQQGTLEWTAVVAERWTSHVAGALTERLKALSRQLQLGVDRARGDPFAISMALLTARRSLTPLVQVASLACAPDHVRAHFLAEIHRFVEQTQRSLEEGAKRVRDDGGRLLKTIRDNPLCMPGATTSPPQEASPAVPGARRRIILLPTDTNA